MDSCQDCGASFQGAPIPEEHQESYGGLTHFSTRIGVEYAYGSPHRYDGISEWLCPFCGARRGRWSDRLLLDGDFERRYGE